MLPTLILVLVSPPMHGRLTDERELRERRSFREMEREERKREAGG